MYYRVKIPGKAVKDAFSAIHTIDSLESFFLPFSDVSRLNRDEDFTPNYHTLNIIREAMKVGDITIGAFDITCGPLMEVWSGFKGEVKPDSQDIEMAKVLVDYKKIDTTGGRVKIPSGMKINLSGVAKGYACDVAVDVLKRNGVRAGLVNCGGDIRVFGDRAFNIGIKDPRGEGLKKVVSLRNEAIVTSGDYENYFLKGGRRFHHVIDPSTGYPSDGCIAVTIVARDAVYADALATGIMVMGPERGDSLLRSINGVRGLLFGERGDSVFEVGNF